MKICEVCSREFEPDTDHPFQVTCGNKQCNILRQRKKIAEKLAIRRIKIKHCERCGKELKLNKYNWPRAKWCLRCGKLAKKEAQSRWQKLHLWESDNPGNWWLAMERDKDICQICSKKGTQVHHIDFNHSRYCSETKKSSSNHSLDNLQVLCGRCHWKIHNPTIRVNVSEKKITISGLLFQVFSDYQIVKS